MSQLVVRRLLIDLDAPIDARWNGGDAFRSAFFNALSLSFPVGEQYFIDSVRNALKALPEAQRARFADEVQGFVGQEATHRRLHALFNGHLAKQGLPNDIERRALRRLQANAQRDVRVHLAATAATEHFTAIFAHWLLRHPEALQGAEPRLQTLWLWHAAEESEHRSTAFDVYQAISGDHAWRIRLFRYVTVTFLVGPDAADLDQPVARRQRAALEHLAQRLAAAAGTRRHVPRQLRRLARLLRARFPPQPARCSAGPRLAARAQHALPRGRHARRALSRAAAQPAPRRPSRPSSPPTSMAITVPFDLSYEFEVKAGAAEVFSVLADVPTSASHFPKVDKLVDLGGNSYRWELQKVGTAQVHIQTIYASTYVADRKKLTVRWTPVEGVGNAQIGGSWTITDKKTLDPHPAAHPGRDQRAAAGPDEDAGRAGGDRRERKAGREIHRQPDRALRRGSLRPRAGPGRGLPAAEPMTAIRAVGLAGRAGISPRMRANLPPPIQPTRRPRS